MSILLFSKPGVHAQAPDLPEPLNPIREEGAKIFAFVIFSHVTSHTTDLAHAMHALTDPRTMIETVAKQTWPCLCYGWIDFSFQPTGHDDY